MMGRRVVNCMTAMGEDDQGGRDYRHWERVDGIIQVEGSYIAEI